MSRLKELRKEIKNLKQQEVADFLGVERTTYVKYENGNTKLDPDTIIRLADYFHVSTDYLLGKSDIRNPGQDDILRFDNLYPITTKKFPLLGEIACGEPIYCNEDRESYVLASTDIKADFCLKAKGDSMINARILDGDIVFIRKQPMVDNGEIAAVVIDDSATLKRVFYYPKEQKLILNAENSKYAPLVYIGEQLEQIRILGLAVAFQSDVK